MRLGGLLSRFGRQPISSPAAGMSRETAELVVLFDAVASVGISLEPLAPTWCGRCGVMIQRRHVYRHKVGRGHRRRAIAALMGTLPPAIPPWQSRPGPGG